MCALIRKPVGDFQVGYPESSEIRPGGTLPFAIEPKSGAVGGAGKPVWLELNVLSANLAASITDKATSESSLAYLGALDGTGTWTVWGQLHSGSVLIVIQNYMAEDGKKAKTLGSLAAGTSLTYELPLIDATTPGIQQLSIPASAGSGAWSTNAWGDGTATLMAKIQQGTGQKDPPPLPPADEVPAVSMTVNPPAPAFGTPCSLAWTVSGDSKFSATLYGPLPGGRSTETLPSTKRSGKVDGIVAVGRQLFQLVADVTLDSGTRVTVQASCVVEVTRTKDYGGIQPATSGANPGSIWRIHWAAWDVGAAWLLNGANTQRVLSSEIPAAGSGDWSFVVEAAEENVELQLFQGGSAIKTLAVEARAWAPRWAYVHGKNSPQPVAIPPAEASRRALSYYTEAVEGVLHSSQGKLVLAAESGLYTAAVGVLDDGSPWRNITFTKYKLPVAGETRRWWGAAGLSDGFVALRQTDDTPVYQLVGPGDHHVSLDLRGLHSLLTKPHPGYVPGWTPQSITETIVWFDMVAIDDLLVVRAVTSAGSAGAAQYSLGATTTSDRHQLPGRCWTVDYKAVIDGTSTALAPAPAPILDAASGCSLVAIGKALYAFSLKTGTLLHFPVSGDAGKRTLGAPSALPSAPADARYMIPVGCGELLLAINGNPDSSTDYACDLGSGEWYATSTQFDPTFWFLAANRTGDSPRMWALGGTPRRPDKDDPPSCQLYSFAAGTGASFTSGSAITGAAPAVAKSRLTIENHVGVALTRVTANVLTQLDSTQSIYWDVVGNLRSQGPIGSLAEKSAEIPDNATRTLELAWVEGQEASFRGLWKLQYPDEGGKTCFLVVNAYSADDDATTLSVERKIIGDTGRNEFYLDSPASGLGARIFRKAKVNLRFGESVHIVSVDRRPWVPGNRYLPENTWFDGRVLTLALGSTPRPIELGLDIKPWGDPPMLGFLRMTFDITKPDGAQLLRSGDSQTQLLAVVMNNAPNAPYGGCAVAEVNGVEYTLDVNLVHPPQRRRPG